jgi:hypothetical protein
MQYRDGSDAVPVLFFDLMQIASGLIASGEN